MGDALGCPGGGSGRGWADGATGCQGKPTNRLAAGVASAWFLLAALAAVRIVRITWG
jgi:hypothetical protein